jgi:hypothetical protein
MNPTKTRESRYPSKKREASMIGRVRLRHRACRSRLRTLICTIVVAAAASMGCTSASDESPGAEPSAPAVSQIEAQSGAPEAFDELQSAPQVASCSSQHGICINRSVCFAEGGRLLTGSGCRSGTVCCRVSACEAAGDFCTSLAECRNLGHTVGLSGCNTGQVCCESD